MQEKDFQGLINTALNYRFFLNYKFFLNKHV